MPARCCTDLFVWKHATRCVLPLEPDRTGGLCGRGYHVVVSLRTAFETCSHTFRRTIAVLISQRVDCLCRPEIPVSDSKASLLGEQLSELLQSAATSPLLETEGPDPVLPFARLGS